MNYDIMSVDELLNEIESDVVEGYPRDIEKVAALRKAVISETSVGKIKCLRRPIMGFNQYGNEFQTGHIDERVMEPPCVLPSLVQS